MASNKATTNMIMLAGSGSTISRVTSSFPLPLRIVSSTGQLTQVRNHVKIYPWRFNRQNRECYLDPTRTPYTDRHNINEFTYKKKRKDWQHVIPKDKDNRFNAFKWNDAYKSDPAEAKATAHNKMNRFSSSLRDRGAARESKPYNPPDDVQDQILAMLKSSQLTETIATNFETDDDSILALDLNQSRALKINLISACIKQFDHDMPSSYLDEMNTVNNVVEYFSTPVRGHNPYTSMLRQDDSLPANLSLLSEPLRYNREQDQFFKGYTALPGIISKIPGLRASKKYPIYGQDEFQWPDI